MTDVLVGRRSVPSVQASGTDERDKRQETEMRPAQRRERERERTGGMARSRVQSAIMHGPFIIFIPFSRVRMLPPAADCDADGAVGPASATRRANERETTQTKQAKAIIERARDNSARHAIIISTHSTCTVVVHGSRSGRRVPLSDSSIAVGKWHGRTCVCRLSSRVAGIAARDGWMSQQCQRSRTNPPAPGPMLCCHTHLQASMQCMCEPGPPGKIRRGGSILSNEA